MIKFDSGKLTMKSSTKAQMNKSITLVGTGTTLPITIIGEFKDIPPHLHELYMLSMLSSYNNMDIYNNVDEDEEPLTIQEQKREWRLNKLVKLLIKQITK